MRGGDFLRWRPIALSLLLAASGVACGPHGEHGPPRPQLTVMFVSTAPATAGLALTAATMTFDHIQVLGNSPWSGPPPGGTEPHEEDLSFDVLAGMDSVTQTVPPGLYSRVAFDIEGCSMAGTWNATPFAAMLAKYQGARVDLRTPTPVEVVTGDQSAALVVTVDPNLWFAAPSPLDAATVGADGAITCNDQQNEPAATELTARLSASFTLQ